MSFNASISSPSAASPSPLSWLCKPEVDSDKTNEYILEFVRKKQLIRLNS